ncbi:hypothetical protein D3Y59_00415 [Hymenobacter oligotrophus]|uniref:Uncharacterized protein n=1 Tax=Hymenobacter oligotrophus TaxID=2319843 RepID=A0A3B7R7M1_9BACT|nr:hypothetical protein [Hymenobacter oligotrophus]AYA35646.1 hypothetical protein D3Y59_00415 [Hymenobacter oligotrophus]
MKKVLFAVLPLLLVMLLSIAPRASYAQCTLCKNNVESARTDKDGYDISGLNKGILYMMAAPYVMGGLVGFFWYRNVRRKRQQAA